MKPSAATLVATTALFVAFGGTSYAAAKIGSADVRNDSLRSSDIKDGTLRKKDLRPGVLTTGPAGPQGPAGAGRWVLVNAAGEIEAQSGGFTVTAAYVTLGEPNPLRANGNVYINANEPLTNNGVVASIALQNQVDQNGDMLTNGRGVGPDANPEFAGEISATQCQIAGQVACAPPGTGNVNHFVVSPRNSDGSFTVDGARKRFYVVVSGDSTDYVAP